MSEEIFSLESLTVDGHVKKGKYVSSHLHFNLTYLLEADSEEAVSIKADENSGVAWFSPEEALMRSTEPWFVEHVYIKLFKKMNLFLMNKKKTAFSYNPVLYSFILTLLPVDPCKTVLSYITVRFSYLLSQCQTSFVFIPL